MDRLYSIHDQGENDTRAMTALCQSLLRIREGNGLHARQFIISTCDDRFFQLARQRFRYLGDRRRVYRFSSCGLDGPLIESA